VPQLFPRDEVDQPVPDPVSRYPLPIHVDHGAAIVLGHADDERLIEGAGEIGELKLQVGCCITEDALLRAHQRQTSTSLREDRTKCVDTIALRRQT
jgi:hypothetical protein